MSSFYGNIKNSNRVSLIFDKVYKNRADMEDAIASNNNGGLGDGIYHGRYVLIDYGEQTYSPYVEAIITDEDHETGLDGREHFNKDFYVWENDTFQKADIYFSTGDRKYYYFSNGNKDNQLYNTINENCEYAKNRKIDEQRFGDCFHHTVWKKIWCEVGESNTAEEKYILVANLDAKVPKISLITDAPEDTFSNIYVYSIVASDLFQYEQISVSTYKQLIELVEACDTTEFEAICWGEDYKIMTLAEASYLTDQDVKDIGTFYKRTIRPNCVGLISEKKFLTNENDLYIKENEQEYIEIPEAKNGHMAFVNAFKNCPGTMYYSTTPSGPKNIVISTDLEAGYFNANYTYYYLTDKYDGPLDRFTEIRKDNDSSLNLISYLNKENRNGLIVDAEKQLNPQDKINLSSGTRYYSAGQIDSFIQNSGLFHFIRNDTDGDKVEPYFIDGYEVYYKNGLGKFSLAVYDDFDWSQSSGHPNEFFVIDKEYFSARYFYESNHNEEQQYYERTSINKGYPHFDPLRSTDLDYKLHVPRNWKFSDETDFSYNRNGFNKNRKSKKENAINEVFLTSFASGELYPDHLEKVPEAAVYDSKNKIKTSAKIDTKKFNIDLPELGNAVSDLWDVLYPVGYFKQITKAEITELINKDLNNKKSIYTCDNPESDEDDKFYTRLTLVDDILDDITYYRFVREDDEKYGANDDFDIDPTRRGRRYLFIGNDREGHKATMSSSSAAEIIREIYDIIGLPTDNDYFSSPGWGTIYGLKNALISILGSYADKFSADNILPITYVGTNEGHISLKYCNSGVYSEQTGYPRDYLSRDAFNVINESAWGPLYKINDISTDVSFERVNITATEYNKVLFNYLNTNGTNEIKTQYYIKNNNDEYVPATGNFNPSTEYYKANIIYTKALVYESDTIYFRNLNTLWSLLREFQEIRDRYSTDWNNDNPLSPAYIQNRPKLILSDNGVRDRINLDGNNDPNYFMIKDNPIESSKTLAELNDAMTNNHGVGVIEVIKGQDKLNFTLYSYKNLFSKTNKEPGAKYYEVNLDAYTDKTLDTRWNESIVTTFSQNFIIFDQNNAEISLRIADFTDINNALTE